jgi:hypothetical protein
VAKLQIDLQELDLDTLALLDAASKGGQFGPVEMRDFLAAFLVDDDGRALALEEAKRAAGKFKLREVREAFAELRGAVAALQEQAVPKAITSG